MSVLFLALVVCVPLLCVCLSFFFLHWFLSFLCFFVTSLFLAVVGFLIRRVCSCVCCLSWVLCLLYCFRVLVFVSVVGGVCMCLMYVPLSLAYVLLPVRGCSFVGVRVSVLLALVCVPYVFLSFVFCSLCCRFL